MSAIPAGRRVRVAGEGSGELVVDMVWIIFRDFSVVGF
jgi:hypothetical protein